PGIARRAEVEALDLRDAGPTQRSLGRLPEVELPAPRDPGAEAPAVGDRDLLADLVAAGADRGADRGGDAPAECSDARLDDPVDQPDPAGMQDADRRRGSVRTDERDRHAVGGESQNG